MRNQIIYTLAAAFIVGYATGCSPAETPKGTPTPTSKTSESTATATVVSRRAPQEEAVEYTRTGGFAGISERWRLFADGRAIDAQGVEYVISEAAMADLLTGMASLGFYDWEVGPRRLGSCADCFTYIINAHYNGQSNQLSFVDGQADVPEGIWIILDRIQAILGTIVESQAN